MPELKTKEHNSSVKEFINSINDEQKKEDYKKLVNIFEEISLAKKIRSSSIIGFGSYHQNIKSERNGSG